MSGPTQLLVNVHFQIRFSDQIQRDTHLPVGSIFKKYVVTLYSQQTAAKVALSVDGLACLQLGVAACEPFEVSAFVQTALQTRRRYFKRVGRMNEVFHVQNRPEMNADFRAILVGHTLRLVNEYTNNRLVLWAGYFGVN